MFTGIVEEVGMVAGLDTRDGGVARLAVGCATVVADAAVGDSISVNGCCLTVTARTEKGFSSDLMGETLARTALGHLRPGDPVNLERAVRADGRLGGHLVQGHVDAVAEVTAVEEQGAHDPRAPDQQWTVMRFTLPEAVAPFVVEKGSIAVDGTSLTVMAVDHDTFAVGLIPHTLAATVLGRRHPGDRVNLEADVVAKYVQRLVQAGAATPYRTA